MAKSSILTSYIQLVPTVLGITNEAKRDIKKYSDLAANTMADGYRQAARSGADDLVEAFKVASGHAANYLQSAMDTVRLDTAALNSQINTVGNVINSQLNQSFNNISIPTTQIASQVGNAMQQGMSNLTLPGGAIPTAQIASQVQNAMQQGMGNVTLPPNTIPQAPLQNQTHAPVQAGATAGITSGIMGAKGAIVGAIAALGIGAAIGKAVSTGLELEKGSAKITAALALDPETAKKAAETSKSLFSNNYGESLEEVNSAVEASLASFRDASGQTTDDIEGITKKALNMSSAFGTDVQNSVMVASTMIKTGFAKDGVNAMDLLSASAQKVAPALREDLVEAVSEYSVYMSDLGIGGERGMNMLINASKGGKIALDKTGDAVKEFQIRSTDLSVASKVGYDAIGLSQEEMAGKLLQGGEVAGEAFNTIVTGLAGIEDPVKQSQAALALFGTQLEDMSVAQTGEFLNSLLPVPGALGDIAKSAEDLDKQLMNTASGSLEALKRQLSVTFGEAMMPLIAEVLPYIKQMNEWVIANKDVIQGWVRDIAGAIQASLIPAIQFLAPIFMDFIGWINENKDTIIQWMPYIITAALLLGGLMIVVNIGTAIYGMVTSIWAATTALYGAAVAGTAFGMSLGWLIALAALVFAVGYAIGTALVYLVQNFDVVWEHIKSFFSSIGQMFSALKFDSFGNAVKSIGYVLLNFLIGIGNAIIAVANMIPYTVNALIGGINDIMGIVGIDFEIGNMPTIPYIPIQIPEMATGGDIMGPTMVLAGEKDPETIVNRGKMNQLMDEVIAGRVGGNNDNGGNIAVTNYITIQKGVTDDDASLAEKIAVAEKAALGSAWKSKRA